MSIYLFILLWKIHDENIRKLFESDNWNYSYPLVVMKHKLAVRVCLYRETKKYAGNFLVRHFQISQQIHIHIQLHIYWL